MNSKLKRSVSAAAASVLAAVSMTAAIPAATVNAADTSFPYTIEGEDMEGAELWEKIYENELPGYSGKGFAYLTGGELSFTVTVPEDGMYTVSARAAQILNEEGRFQTMAVNGSEFSKTIPYTKEWKDFEFGVVRLNKGENTISFLNKYGYMAIDSVTVKVAEPHDYSKATDVCVDPKATAETQALMKYLKSVYGKHVIAGQQEIYGGGHKNNYEWENEYIQDLTGKLPAIRALDFMNYNPLYGWDDNTTERAIAWVKEKNGIISASWHINVPIDFEGYELGDEVDWQKCTYKNYQASNSTFNTANVLKEGTKERAYFDEAMKMLAEQLKRLQDENVPIIFRPLHEAQGNDGLYGDGTAWFWWGDRGPEVYKGLWKLLYTTLTEKYELHNIIWEFNSYDYETSPLWYPGDEYVDIVAYDKYNVEYNRGDGKTSGPNLLAIPAKFDYLFNLTNGKKMVSMSENDTIPAVDNMIVEDAYWLYVCPWYDGGEDGGTAFLSEKYQDLDEFKKFYQSDLAITLDELPEDLYKGGSTTPAPATTAPATKPAETKPAVTTATAVSSTTAPADGDIRYGDANLDKDVTLADALLILQYVANSKKYPIEPQGIINADCFNSGDGVTAKDALSIQRLDARVISSLPEKA